MASGIASFAIISFLLMAKDASFLLMAKDAIYFLLHDYFRMLCLISFLHSQGSKWPFFKGFWGLRSLTGGRKHDTEVMPQSKCKFYLGSSPTDFLSLKSAMNFNMILIATQWLTFNLQSMECIDHIHQVTEVPLL